MAAALQLDPKTGLAPVQKVLEHVKYRAEHRVTLDVPKVSDLNIRWMEQGDGRSKSGYYARIDGRDLRLTDAARKTACRQIQAVPKFFDQFADRDAFPKTLRHIVDNPNRRAGNGVLVRHNGLEVNAVLPRAYQVKDAVSLLGEFVEDCEASIAPIRGILPVEQGDGDFCSYRLVMGNNLMPGLRDDHGQFIMFVLTMSETGMIDAQTVLGLYRHTCTNSAIRQQTMSKWDHLGDIGKFYDSTQETVRMTGYLCDQFGRVFSELAKLPLQHAAMETLGAMKATRSISKAHYDASRVWGMGMTEDGRKVETHYDLYNVLTKAAQELPSVESRQNAEQAAMDLFTSPGGLYTELERRAARVRLRDPLFLSSN